MVFSYSFSNLLGAVYRKGTIVFSADGDSLIAPVGNRLATYNLKRHSSATLPVESRHNITAVAVSPNGALCICSTEEGELLLISQLSHSLIASHHTHATVRDIKFSPNGEFFTVTRGDKVMLFLTPNGEKTFSPFDLKQQFFGSRDDVVHIDWSSDSRVFAAAGQDANTRIYPAFSCANFTRYAMGGHSDPLVGSFFEEDSLDLYSVSANGQVCIWRSNMDLSALEERPTGQKQVQEVINLDETEVLEEETATPVRNPLVYQKLSKLSYKESRGATAAYARITAADFNKRTHMLCAAFDDGSFYLHEMPDFSLVHSLSIGENSLTAVRFNKTGDWLAVGSESLGQLCVWEWASETFLLRQQAHFNSVTTVGFAPDGQHLATGSDDSKVKLWSLQSGFCLVTFSDHTAPITAVRYTQSGRAVCSASLDGTVRAFDVARYRNFRTFTSPTPVQFSSLAVDPAGELVAAGVLDNFDCYVWSFRTGHLLEVLAGHVGPVSTLDFAANSMLATGSWDHTVTLWSIVEGKGSKEKITLSTDVIDVCWRPDGTQLAVLTLDCQITVWDATELRQVAFIEGRRDMGYTRRLGEQITAKKASEGRSFTTISFSADGTCVIAAGQSCNVCIYDCASGMLVGRYTITQNLSLNGVQEFLDRRKMTKWGNLDLVEESTGAVLPLPGVRRDDKSTRNAKPDMLIHKVAFSPTGQCWAAASTEGLLLFSQQRELIFDPFKLDTDVTPEQVEKELAAGSLQLALQLALRLNDSALTRRCVEATPRDDISLVLQTLPLEYVTRLLSFLPAEVETNPQMHLYLIWANTLLLHRHLKNRAGTLLPQLTALQKAVSLRAASLSRIAEYTDFTAQFIIAQNTLRRMEISTET